MSPRIHRRIMRPPEKTSGLSYRDFRSEIMQSSAVRQRRTHPSYSSLASSPADKSDEQTASYSDTNIITVKRLLIGIGRRW